MAANVMIAIVLLAVMVAAVTYIVKAKKSGAKCIGCPAEGGCVHSKNNASDCGCTCHAGTKDHWN